jgi:transcriptional regulator with XRE-family HTH domain
MKLRQATMQGSELKAIRETLGWGQRRFAEEIGMTQTYISQMEQGKKPIERRTELAARYLALKGSEDT